MPNILIELSNEDYARLQALATRQEEAANALASRAVRTHIQEADRDFEETCAAIAEGLADLEAGRHIPWEQFVAEFDARHESRRRSKQAKQAVPETT